MPPFPGQEKWPCPGHENSNPLRLVVDLRRRRSEFPALSCMRQQLDSATFFFSAASVRVRYSVDEHSQRTVPGWQQPSPEGAAKDLVLDLYDIVAIEEIASFEQGVCHRVRMRIQRAVPLEGVSLGLFGRLAGH